MLLLLLACAHDATSREGDDAEECRDGADNDINGAFDCSDAGCAASPDCAKDTGAADTDTDTDTDADTDTDTDTDADSAADTDSGVDPGGPLDIFGSFSLVYTFEWDFDDGYAAYLEAYGIGDCVSSYVAAGEPVSRDGTAVTFLGPWGLAETDCGGDLETAVWTNGGADTYATFRWSADLAHLDDWVEHASMESDEPVEEPSKHKQWYITEMAAPFADGVAIYDLEEATSIDIIPVVLVHHAEFTFTAR